MSVQLSDEVLVRRALELAVRGVEADPNPRVGAVIVDAAGMKGTGTWTKLGVVVESDGNSSYMAFAFKVKNPNKK